MMAQWIIMAVIVLLAFYYAGYLIYQYLKKTRKKEKDEDCDSCSQDCKECPLMIENNKFTKTNTKQ